VCQVSRAEGQPAQRPNVRQWLHGYITGRNFEANKVQDYAGGIRKSRSARLDINVLQDHPLGNFYEASNALVCELTKTNKFIYVK
jgi:hypothetical protein